MLLKEKPMLLHRPIKSPKKSYEMNIKGKYKELPGKCKSLDFPY